jgi:hypothetical protein
MIEDLSECGPVGVDASERSMYALALAELLGPALGPRVAIAYAHPYGTLSGVFSGAGNTRRSWAGFAESTFEQIRPHLSSVPESRLQLLSEDSPAAGLPALGGRGGDGSDRDGSSHRSKIGRGLVGGTGERLLSGVRRLSRLPGRTTRRQWRVPGGGL